MSGIGPDTPRRHVVGLCLAILALLSTALPAEGSGDLDAPAVVSLDVSPDSADVTTSGASFSVVMRVTDNLSGTAQVDMSFSSTRENSGITLTRTGTENDATYSGSFSVVRNALPGRYRLFVVVSDRVGNRRSYDAAALAASGLDSGVDITGPAGDVTPPSVTGVVVTPAIVDARSGAATASIEITATDNQSGVNSLSAFVRTPEGTSGGVSPAILALVSGSNVSGVWRGTFTFPLHTP